MPSKIPYVSAITPVAIFGIFEKYDTDKNGLSPNEILKLSQDMTDTKEEAMTGFARILAMDKNGDQKLTCHEMLGDWLNWEKDNGWPDAKWVEE
ncbi:hypothetical protein BDV27DRAFT_158695 [Aspergillus caelatus]|uniref:EF-hand domain-containing protein n=1 Tax=Aspergillus caelatus TaxID=61420 RepID=A0A5N7A246_9EURO|nr:uncharacterized protein BDV27DRAFT_158695 [Aspergillus caelatus]KAE8363528.1 hypothetical protein BDV27DRAFT_158695 [Aspergillus caelatus]